jgi:AcrR family transcriptional regulator
MDIEEEPWPFPWYPRSSRAEKRMAAQVQRHRERGLSRAEIVGAAIAVADAEGPDAISMRRIARELGAGAMSLYWHVASKEELLYLMLDAIEAEIEVPDPSGDWRADLRGYARSARAVMLRHRWAMDFLGGRPPSGPNSARNADRGLALLGRLGLDPRLTIDIVMTVATYVVGAVVREAQELRGEREQRHAEAGLTEQEIEAERARYRAWFLTHGRYPHLSRLMEADVDPDDPATRDERFEFGLGCVLDGIAARVMSTTS